MMTIHIFVEDEDITVTVFNKDRQVTQSVFDHNNQSCQTLLQRIGLYRRQKGMLYLCNDITFVEECFAMYQWRIWLTEFDEESKLATKRNLNQ